MFNCKECLNKSICKIFSKCLEFQAIADVQVYNCSKLTKNIVTGIEFATSPLSHIEKTITSYDINPTIVGSTNREQTKARYEVFQEKQKELEEKTKNKETITENENLSTAPYYVTCPTCSGTTVKDDLNNCTNCLKTICSNCATIFEGKNLCDECWENE